MVMFIECLLLLVLGFRKLGHMVMIGFIICSVPQT